jgi:hypothetical protein
MVAFAGCRHVSYALERADTKRQLRIGSKPNADRSGEWSMSIIKHMHLLEASRC